MRIAIFTPSFLPKRSGAEIFHHNLAVRLALRGHAPVLVLPRKNARALMQTGWSLPYGIEPFPGNVWSYYKRWPFLARAWSAWLLDRLQKRHHFDLWHAVMTFPTGITLIPWATARGVPHVVRSAGDDVISSRDGSIGLRREAFVASLIAAEIPKAGAVIALSETIAREFVALGVPAGCVHEIPNAVDLARFQQEIPPSRLSALRQKFGLRADGFVFLAVGRNNPQKNYPALLEAAAGLVREGFDFQILLLGRDTSKLGEEVARLGLAGRVLCGEIAAEAGAGSCPEFPPAELIQAYRMADAFVMPSLLEGFSTALLEAMAAGLPVLTTDAPGCGDFVRQGRDALMVPAGNAEALKGEMRRILQEPALRRELSGLSQKRAAEFSWENVADRYEALYLSLAQRKQKTKQVS